MSSPQLKAWTLVIEASTVDGSVALLASNEPTTGSAALEVVEVRRVQMGPSSEDTLFPAVTALLDGRLAGQSLAAVVCGAGPGSFTSLRIAASVAKGIAQATGARFFAVPSLLLAAASCNRPGQFVVHADALRGERYVQGVEISPAGTVRATEPLRRVPTAQLGDLAQGRELISVGSGSPTAVLPDASRLGAVDGWKQLGEVDLSSWEPAYGRLAEAQVKWEATHARPLPIS